MAHLKEKQNVIPKHYCLGGGAVFWVYISTENQTTDRLKYWRIIIEHEDKAWHEEISSEQPAKVIKTPDLCGIFYLTVETMGSDSELEVIRPTFDSQPEVGCSAHCASMIGLEATEEGEIQYWTVWNAICKSDFEL